MATDATDMATAIQAGIQAGIQAAMASMKPPSVAVEQTSIDTYQPSEVTVRFRKWTAFNGTAYMRGQQAGFPRSQVADLERRGIVEIMQVAERDIAPGMRRSVTK